MKAEYKAVEGQKQAFVIEFDSQEDFICFCNEVRFACAQYADALSVYAELADSVSDFLNKIMERGKHHRTPDGKPMSFLYESEATCYVVDSMRLLFSYCTLVNAYETLDEQQRNDFACMSNMLADLLSKQNAVSDADGEIINSTRNIINMQADYIDMLEKKVAELSEHSLMQTEMIECREKIYEAQNLCFDALESGCNIICSMQEECSDEI